ncbi:MAG: hypothetical protein QOF51_2462 [Chloroflexota bacterium]|jgi:alkanesulfonate monooxygenase SsuD/methylene tetrahydromethanopterin reductase-like flavin-dependent oxidoreductase (luciferase family)|nr:hypothetical protein [Chloroflexota bacterium]
MVTFDYYLLNTYVPEAEGSASELYARWVEQIVLAEELGFGCAWLTEHHFHPFGGMLPSPQLLIAALASRTSRIRMGPAVTILPLHNPVRIAEDMAMLDVLTGGRLEVGVGRGMGNQYYDVFGADPSTAQQKFEEQVAMLRTAWSDEPLRWDGAFFHCPRPVNVTPKPVQRPHPPLWIPVNADLAHARWVGQQSINLMTLPWYPPTFAPTRRLIDEYRAGLKERERPEQSCEVLAYLTAYVGETPERAQREAEPHWEAYRHVAADQRGGPEVAPLSYETGAATSRCVFGDAEMCRQHVRRLRDELGIDRLALRFDFGGMAQDLVLASMRRFASEVAPVLAWDN